MAPTQVATALGAPFNEVTNPSAEIHDRGWIPGVPNPGLSIFSADVDRTSEWAGPNGGRFSMRMIAEDVGAAAGTTNFYHMAYAQENGSDVLPGIPMTVGNALNFAFDAKVVAVNPEGASFNLKVSWRNAAGAVISEDLVFVAPVGGADLVPVRNFEGVLVGSSGAAPAGTVRAWLIWQAIVPAGSRIEAYIDNLIAVDDPDVTPVPIATPWNGSTPGFGWEGAWQASRSGTGTAFGDPFEAHPRALTMLESLPYFLRDDPDVRAVIYAQGRAAEEHEALLDDLLDQLRPTTATDTGLAWQETLLRTSKEAGDTTSERRERVLDRYLRVAGEPAGSGWEAAVSLILGDLGDDWKYEEHVPASAIRTNEAFDPRMQLTLPADWWTVHANVSRGNASAPDYEGGTALTVEMVNDAQTNGDIIGLGSSGLVPVTPALPYLYARCKGKVFISQFFASSLQLTVTYLKASLAVRATQVVWSSVDTVDTLALSDAAFEAIGVGVRPANTGTPADDAVYARIGLRATVTATNNVNLDMEHGDWLLERFAANPSTLESIPTYFHGNMPGFAWLGTPDESQSTTASAADDTINVYVPFSAASADAAWKVPLVRDLTPSHLDINWVYDWV